MKIHHLRKVQVLADFQELIGGRAFIQDLATPSAGTITSHEAANLTPVRTGSIWSMKCPKTSTSKYHLTRSSLFRLARAFLPFESSLKTYSRAFFVSVSHSLNHLLSRRCSPSDSTIGSFGMVRKDVAVCHARSHLICSAALPPASLDGRCGRLLGLESLKLPDGRRGVEVGVGTEISEEGGKTERKMRS